MALFYEENSKKYFGERFGYAIEYSDTDGVLTFRPEMIQAENWHERKPSKKEIVSECIYAYTLMHKNDVIVKIYDTTFTVTSRMTKTDIRKKITDIQMKLVSVNSSVPSIEQQIMYVVRKNLDQIDVF